MTGTDDVILQTAQREISLCKEITTTTSWIKEGQRCQFVLKGIKFTHALFLYLLFKNGVKLLSQVVKEQRVYHFVDVLNARIVHTTTTTGLRIQRTLKNGTKDGG